MSSSKATSAPSTRATRREWIGLAVLALPCLLYSMDLTVLHLAIPALTRDLEPSATQLLWIIDIYGFMVAGALITMGTLGDRVGRRRVLLIGAAAFGAASIVAAYSTSAEMLITSRAVLGLAGATVAPSTLSLIRNMFLDPRQFTFAIGVWISSYSVGGAIGPLVGGLLLQHFWWGSVFLIAVPVMLLILVLGPILLPEYRDPSAKRLDVLSAGMSLLAVLSIIFSLKQLAQDGPGPVPAICAVVGLALSFAFVRRQRALSDPLIDVRLFADRSFSAALVLYMLSILTMFGGILFIPQYLQLVLGLSPLEAGLWTVPWALSFVVGSMVTPLLVRRIRTAFLMAGGLVMAGLGNLLLSQIDSAGLWVLVVGGLMLGLGLSPMFTLATDLIVGTAPPERAGAAGALSETSAELGGALGIAVMGSLGLAVYRAQLAETMPPGVPPEAADAARETLAGAMLAAASLPEQLAQSLVSAANAAFVAGLEVASIVSTILVMGVAVAVLALLREVRPREASDDGGGEDLAASRDAVAVG